MEERIKNIVFFNDGFDWPLRSNRYWAPFIWSKKAKVLSVEYPSFSRTVKQLLGISRLPIFERKGKGFYIYRGLAILPFNREFSFFERINHFFNFLILRFFLLPRLGFDYPLLWFFYPQAYWLMRKINHQLTIYHLVDVLSEYSFFYKTEAKKRWLEKVEREVAKRVDLIFATSPVLYQKMKRINKKTFLVDNASNTSFLIRQIKKKPKKPEELKKTQGPIAGFIGGIDKYRFDLELLKYLAENLPNVSFVIVGPVGRGGDMTESDLPQRKNIFYLGLKPFKEIPRYLAHFDACLLLYPKNKYTKGVMPVTLFEYFASGKPVVAPGLPSLRAYQELVYLAKGEKDFLKKLKLALREKEEKIKRKRVGLAQKHSWEFLIERMEKLIREKWQPRRAFLNGLPIDYVSLKTIVPNLKNLAKKEKGSQLVSYLNANNANLTFTNRRFQKILSKADLVYADGWGVVLAFRLFGYQLPGRLTAKDFFEEFCQMAEKKKLSLFFLGGKEKVASKMVKILKDKFPQIKIKGWRDGYFSRREEKSILAKINKLKPDFLIVGMNSPTQEMWLAKNLNRLEIKVGWCVGGLFDFVSEEKPRCPKWLGDLGFEWLFRLLTEPKRLWKRYLIGGPMFFFRIIGLRIKETREV